jgi:hypothetical protein
MDGEGLRESLERHPESLDTGSALIALDGMVAGRESFPAIQAFVGRFLAIMRVVEHIRQSISTYIIMMVM